MKNTDFELEQLGKLISGESFQKIQELFRDLDLEVVSFKAA